MYTDTALRPAALAQDPTAPVGRRELLDRKRQVVGYELFARSRAHAATDAPADSTSPDRTVFTALADGGKAALVGRKTVFVHCADAALNDDTLDRVPPDGVVLVFTPQPGLPQAEIDTRTRQLAALRQRGFGLGFTHAVLGTPFAAWLPLAAHVTLDLAALQPAIVAPLVQKARTFPHIKLLAHNVNTVALYTRMSELGVTLFEGSWLSQPVAASARTIRPSQATILQLIQLLQTDADLAAIEEVLKRDPTLSFNLLRFINSSGFGLRCEITSFRHAAMIIGQKNLCRWAALLLTASKDSAAPPAIGSTAIVRGRLTELLAAELLAPGDCDNAFIVGVFSLLDAMLGVPMAQALDQLPLPEPVTDALLYRTGPFAPFLDLAIACESGEDEGFAKAARTLHLSNHQINWAHLQALAWGDALLA